MNPTQAAVVDLEKDQCIRECACGCKLRFQASAVSRRIYYSSKHRKRAKNLRRKLKEAGIPA